MKSVVKKKFLEVFFMAVLMIIAICAVAPAGGDPVLIVKAAGTVPTHSMEFTILNGTDNTFTAIEEDGKLTDGITNVSMTNLIAAIDAARTSDNVAYVPVALNFGDMTVEPSIPLNLGTTDSLVLSKGIYIIQSGTVESSSTNYSIPTISFSGTELYITGGEIKNLTENSSSRSLINSETGTVFMSGGLVSGTAGRTIQNTSTGEVNISGGTVEATSGYAIYNSSTGKITVSQADDAMPTLITSKKNATSQGTIMLNSGASEDIVLEITGGTVQNTFETGTNARVIQNNGSGIINISGGRIENLAISESASTIFNNSAGTVNISGGTIFAAGSSKAIYNNSTGILNMNGGMITGVSGNLIYNYANGTININRGTVISETGNAVYCFSNSTGTINISGGTISSTGNGASTVYNGGSGLINVTGGSISGADGNAIFNNSTGKIKISQEDDLVPAVITSARTSSNRGTIHMNNAGGSLEIGSGEIGNTGRISAGTIDERPGNIISNNVGASVTLGTEIYTGTLAMNISGNMIYTGNEIILAVEILGLASSIYTVSGSNNTNAGIAKILATLSGSYGSAVFFTNFTIDKAMGSGASITMNDWIYGQSASNPSVSGQHADYGTPTYEYKIQDADDSTYSATKPTNVGSYTVRANFAATVNYEAYSVTEDFAITKAMGSGASILMNDWIYGQAASNPSVSGQHADYGVPTYQYKTQGAADSTYSATKPTNAGNYTIKANFAATANHEAYSITKDFTITKANGTGSVSVKNWAVGEDANAPTISNVPSEYGTPVYEYKLKNADDSTYSVEVPLKKGEYTVRATFVATANYKAFSITSDFTIAGSGGLSGGAIAGIVIVCVIIVASGGFSIFWFAVKKKKFADLIDIFKKKQ